MNVVSNPSIPSRRLDTGGRSECRPTSLVGAAPEDVWLPVWFGWAAVGFLGLLCLIAYANSFSAAFTLDNVVVIQQDPRLHEWSPENVRLVFTKSYWWPQWETNLYRPLTTLSYLFNWSVLGNADRPAGYHVVNLLLHWVATMLVFAIARRLTGRALAALLAAALFAVHPVATEGVTNIVGRADELVTIAVLAGYLCHLRARATEDELGRGFWRIALGVIAFVGVFAKESAIVLVALLPLHDWIFDGPAWAGPWRERLRNGAAFVWSRVGGYLPLVPAVLALGSVRYVMFRHSPVYAEIFVDNPIARSDLLQGWLTAFKVLGRYLGLLVWPATLSADYSYNQIPLYGEADSLWEDVQCWLGLGAVGLLIGLALRVRRTQPLFCFGTLFFFTQLLPTANLLRPIGSIMGERFLYLPLVGFCLVAAPALLAAGSAAARFSGLAPGGMAGEAGRTWRSLAFLILPLLVIGALTARTLARNADWHDNLSLWRSAARASPQSYKVHQAIADEMYRRDPNEATCDAAIAEGEVGLRIMDEHPLAWGRRDNTLFIALGRLYLAKGDHATARQSASDAERAYRKGQAILSRAREVDQWVNSASRRKRLDAGVAADEIPDVGNSRVHSLLALAHVGLGEWNQAVLAADYACRIGVLQPDAYSALAVAHLAAGNADAAAICTLQVLILQEKSTVAWARLERICEIKKLVPSMVAQGPNGLGLNASTPQARAWLNQACRGLLERLRTARLENDVEVFRRRAIQQYMCPPSALE